MGMSFWFIRGAVSTTRFLPYSNTPQEVSWAQAAQGGLSSTSTGALLPAGVVSSAGGSTTHIALLVHGVACRAVHSGTTNLSADADDDAAAGAGDGDDGVGRPRLMLNGMARLYFPSSTSDDDSGGTTGDGATPCCMTLFERCIVEPDAPS